MVPSVNQDGNGVCVAVLGSRCFQLGTQIRFTSVVFAVSALWVSVLLIFNF